MPLATAAPSDLGAVEVAPSEEVKVNLDADQGAAVHASLERPLLVVAGPGAGKTRVLTQRIIHLVRSEVVSPAEVVAITFTNASAAEMSERVAAELPANQSGVRISTIHALAAQVVRRHPEVVGLDARFSIFDSDDQLQLARSAVERSAPGIDAQELLRRIGIAKANLEDSTLWLVQGEDHLASAFDLYEADLQAANALDFEGLVRAAAIVLSDDRVAVGWRGGIKALLVDEFHDVSEAQFALVRLLVSGGAGLTVVADDDQIVYGFRGADPEFTVDFERYFPGAAEVVLRRNYRSHGGIVESALQLIGHNERRRPKALEAAEGVGPLPIHESYDSEEQEAEAVVAWALSHIAAGTPPGQLGVLMRMRSLRVRRDLEIALATRGIPYTTLGQRALWQRSEVRDALAWLTLTINPTNSVAFARALESRPDLGPATARTMIEVAKARGVAYEELCLVPGETGIGESRGKAAIDFGESMAQIRRIATTTQRDFKMLVGDIIVLSGIPDRLSRRGKAASGQLGSVRELFRAASSYQRQCEADGRSPALAEFLEELSLHSGDAQRTGSALALGTVHAVKGLEFAHVWIAGLDEGVMPSTRSLQEGGSEEERRLCYVAITRARESLVMSSCAQRWGKAAKTSRFVAESGL